MSRTTSRWQCWHCRREMTAAGRYSHLMGHYRHGEINRTWIPTPRRGDLFAGYWDFRSKPRPKAA